MKQSYILSIIIFCITSFASSFTMDLPVQTPCKEVLLTRFWSAHLSYFAESTNLLSELANKNISPQEIITIVDKSLSEYHISADDKNLQRLMMLRKQTILTTILEGHPQALALCKKKELTCNN